MPFTRVPTTHDLAALEMLGTMVAARFGWNLGTPKENGDRLDALEERLEHIDLAVTEAVVFLETLLDRQTQHGLDGLPPVGP